MEHPSDYQPGNQAKETAEPSTQDTGQALLSLVQEVFGDVPDEQWDQLPCDLAYQHDHYLYSTRPKP